VAAGDAVRGLDLLDELGATAVVLPELGALAGVDQNVYHHLDVHGHTRAVLGRLRASQRLSEYVAGLVRHHLRLGFLVHEPPLSRRALYRYLRACEPETDGSLLLNLARVPGANSLGPSALHGFIQRSAPLQLRFEECPRWFVGYLNLIPGFVPRDQPVSSIISVFVPYACDPCATTADVLTPIADVEIEERAASEVTTFAPPGTEAWNPAFDVTPAALVTALITERGVLEEAGAWRA